MSMHARNLTATLPLLVLLTACGDVAAPSQAANEPPRLDVISSTGGDHSLVNGSEIQWGDPLPCFPQGAQLAVIGGNPLQAGSVWTVRLLMPDGYVIDPHSHPTDENVTVLSGTLMFGFGSHYDEGALNAYGAGGFFTAPAGVNHFVKARGRTEVQVHGLGPFALVYYEQPHGYVPDCPAPQP